MINWYKRLVISYLRLWGKVPFYRKRVNRLVPRLEQHFWRTLVWEGLKGYVRIIVSLMLLGKFFQMLHEEHVVLCFDCNESSVAAPGETLCIWCKEWSEGELPA